MLRNIFCLALFFCAAVLPGWAGRVATKDAALARAQDFMAAVGWTASGTPTMTLSTNDNFSGCWEIVFPGSKGDEEVSIKINRSGWVRSGLNYSQHNRANNATPATLTPARATEVATRYLKSAGFPLKEMQQSSNKQDGMGRWEVRYRRVYHGYTYESDSAFVCLDPYSAALISFSSFFTTPAPKSLRVTVKEAQAVATAHDYLQQHRVPVEKLHFARLEIVRPNGYYEHRGREERPNYSRLAWVVEFNWDHSHIAQAWVDAQTGKVVGGMKCA